MHGGLSCSPPSPPRPDGDSDGRRLDDVGQADPCGGTAEEGDAARWLGVRSHASQYSRAIINSPPLRSKGRSQTITRTDPPTPMLT